MMSSRRRGSCTGCCQVPWCPFTRPFAAFAVVYEKCMRWILEEQGAYFQMTSGLMIWLDVFDAMSFLCGGLALASLEVAGGDGETCVSKQRGIAGAALHGALFYMMLKCCMSHHVLHTLSQVATNNRPCEFTYEGLVTWHGPANGVQSHHEAALIPPG